MLVRYELHTTSTARRQFKQLPASVQKTLRRKLDALCECPFKSGPDVKKLQGREGYRLRVGDYRVLYRLDTRQRVIEVMEVGHRREIHH